jgi:hypothetical protein
MELEETEVKMYIASGYGPVASSCKSSDKASMSA